MSPLGFRSNPLLAYVQDVFFIQKLGSNAHCMINLFIISACTALFIFATALDVTPGVGDNFIFKASL